MTCGDGRRIRLQPPHRRIHLPLLPHRPLRHHRSERRLQPHDPFGRHRKVRPLPSMRCHPWQDRAVNFSPQQFQHIIGERMSPFGVGMEEPCGAVKAGSLERSGHLGGNNRIGIIQDGVHWMHGVARPARDGACAIMEMRPLIRPTPFFVHQFERPVRPIFECRAAFDLDQLINGFGPLHFCER